MDCHVCVLGVSILSPVSIIYFIRFWNRSDGVVFILSIFFDISSKKTESKYIKRFDVCHIKSNTHPFKVISSIISFH